MGKVDLLPFADLALGGAQTGMNMIMQQANNRQMRAFAREMYDKQRTDSLSDWNMQNFFNSPAEQMKRLKEAGLNPNLVYGHGQAQQNAGPVRPSSASTPNTQAVRAELPSVMGIYDMRAKQADMEYKTEAIENLRKDRQVKDAQILETMARVPGYAIKQGLDAYNLEWSKSTDALRKEGLTTGIASQKAGIAKTEADTAYTLSENERKAAMQAYTLSEAYERIMTMRIGQLATKQQMEKTGVETELAREDLKLRKQGIYPGDPVWLRTLINKLDDIKSPVESVKDYFKKSKSGNEAKKKLHQSVSPFPWMR